MRKLPLIATLLLVAAACSHKNSDGDGQHADATPQATAAPEETATAGAAKGVSPERNGARKKPWTNNIGRYNEVFNDSNYIQYRYAERLGIDPMHTLADTYNTRRPLVKIESGEHYEVDELTHSMPYLVPEAARLLDEIGDDFGSLLQERGGDRDNNRIIVTSALRSPYTVRKLRRVNRNAVDSSTHMFGTTFDISWNNFHHPDSTRADDAIVLKGILAEVLLRKRQEGKCLVKFERKTPCFHITVTK